jgi:hypothetical protein
MKSNDNLRGSIDAAAQQQEQNQRYIASLADLIRRREMTIDGVPRTLGLVGVSTP